MNTSDTSPLPSGRPEDLPEYVVFTTDLAGKILTWSEGVQSLFGYSREEFIGQSAEILLPCAERRSGVLQSRLGIARREGSCSAAAWLVRNSGELIFSGLSVSRLDSSGGGVAAFACLVRRNNEPSWYRDSAGNRSAIVETDCDITSLLASENDRETLRNELIETRARFEAIVQQMPLGVLIARAPSGELVVHNEEASRLLRHPIPPAANIHEYSWLVALHPDGTPYQPDAFPLAQAILGKVVKHHELRCRRGDGAVTDLLVSAYPVRDSAGNVVAGVMVFADVSERKSAEIERERLLQELRRSNDDLSQFAHIVSHDLQAPLRTMRSYSDLLLRRYSDSLDASGAEFIQFIAAGAERMDELVQALLQYARAGGPQLTLEETPVAEIVSHAIHNLQPQIENTGAVVEHGGLPTLRVDAMQMTQVFQNLIGNALKYCAPGVTPRVAIAAEPRDGYWMFSVTDNGIGIPSKQHERIFAPLKRLHGATVPGSGMGLAICRRIVQRHGGEIWVQSEPGQGSIFRFTLPA